VAQMIVQGLREQGLGEPEAVVDWVRGGAAWVHFRPWDAREPPPHAGGAAAGGDDAAMEEEEGEHAPLGPRGDSAPHGRTLPDIVEGWLSGTLDSATPAVLALLRGIRAGGEAPTRGQVAALLRCLAEYLQGAYRARAQRANVNALVARQAGTHEEQLWALRDMAGRLPGRAEGATRQEIHDERLAAALDSLGLGLQDANALLALRGWQDGGAAVQENLEVFKETLEGDTPEERSATAHVLAARLAAGAPRPEGDLNDHARRRLHDARLKHAITVMQHSPEDALALLTLLGMIEGGTTTQANLDAFKERQEGDTPEERSATAHALAADLAAGAPRAEGDLTPAARGALHHARLHFAINNMGLTRADAMGLLKLLGLIEGGEIGGGNFNAFIERQDGATPEGRSVTANELAGVLAAGAPRAEGVLTPAARGALHHARLRYAINVMHLTRADAMGLLRLLGTKETRGPIGEETVYKLSQRETSRRISLRKRGTFTPFRVTGPKPKTAVAGAPVNIQIGGRQFRSSSPVGIQRIRDMRAVYDVMVAHRQTGRVIVE
jgi:hypothetical protein